MPHIIFRVTCSDGTTGLYKYPASMTLAAFDNFVSHLPFDADFEIVSYAA